MEDPTKSAVVFDISSDEEVDYGGGEGGDVDLKWIRKLLDDDDDDEKVEGFNGGGDSEDSDDLVVVVGEVCGNRNPSLKKSSSGGDSDDDDCVILDGDPDKPMGVEKEKGEFEDGYVDDSDDLVVVSEKGQVACRDFPHPRHLCAKFPFLSSRHDTHCDQCHCYVCDSLAPCVYWGTGVSSVDHCHATDKEAFWKSQRSQLRRPPLADQSLPLVPNLVQQDKVLRQFTVRPCSTPPNIVAPNVTRQGPRPGYVVPRTYQTHLISQHLADTSPHVSITNRRHNNRNMPPQRPQFKRTAEAVFSSGRSGISPSRLNYGSRLPTDPQPTARWQGSHGRMTPVPHTSQSSSLSNVGQVAGMLSPQTDPILGNRFSNTMPTPQMLPLQSRGSENGNGILSQPQIATQRHISPGYTSYMSQTSSHCPVDDGSVNSQHPVSPCTLGVGAVGDSFVSGPQTTYQLDMGYGFINTTPTPHQPTDLTKQNKGRTLGFSKPTQSQIFRQFEADTEYVPFSLPNAESSSIDQFLPYQSPEYNQPTIVPNSHDTLHPSNQRIFDALSSDVAISDSGPVSCSTASTHLLGCSSRLQNAAQTDYFSEPTNFYRQDPNPADFGTKDLEAWLSVDHSVPNPLGFSAPLLNTPIPSPELASLDGSGLFID